MNWNWMKALSGALQIIAAAPVLVKASLEIANDLEDSIEGPSKGAEKKKLATDAMRLTLDTADSVSGGALGDKKEPMLGLFGSLVDLAVGTFNLVGKFKK